MRKGVVASHYPGQIAQVSLIRLDSSIQIEQCGLLFVGKPSLNSWEAIGGQLVALMESSTWWIADWLAYGEKAFQDRYLEAIKRTDLNYQTLRNYVWVARRFDISRRHENLSFGHHAEVAALDPPEQDYWLRKAGEYGWSRNHLRSQVRASLRERDDQAPSGGGADGAPKQIGTLRLELTDEQISLFESVADVLSLSLHEWALSVLEAAAVETVDGAIQ